MKIEILSIDHFNIMAESEAEVAILDHWSDKNISLRDISTDNVLEPVTLECLIINKPRK